MGDKEEKKKREQWKVTIGPLLKKILEQQKENIFKASFGCIKPGDYDTGEIIAKKILEKGGIKICNKDII